MLLYPNILIVGKAKSQVLYSQHFILFVTYELVQKARVFVSDTPIQLNIM